MHTTPWATKPKKCLVSQTLSLPLNPTKESRKLVNTAQTCQSPKTLDILIQLHSIFPQLPDRLITSNRPAIIIPWKFQGMPGNGKLPPTSWSQSRAGESRRWSITAIAARRGYVIGLPMTNDPCRLPPCAQALSLDPPSALIVFLDVRRAGSFFCKPSRTTTGLCLFIAPERVLDERLVNIARFVWCGRDGLARSFSFYRAHPRCRWCGAGSEDWKLYHELVVQYERLYCKITFWKARKEIPIKKWIHPWK